MALTFFPSGRSEDVFCCPTAGRLENGQNGKEKTKGAPNPVPLTLRAPSVDASERADRALGERGRRMSSDADADARRRRAAELRAECERLRDERPLRDSPRQDRAPGTEQAPEEDAEDAGAKRSKGSKKSKAETDAPVVRDRLTDAERLDAVTANPSCSNARNGRRRRRTNAGSWTSARRATRSTRASRSSRKLRTTSRGRWRSAR